MQFVTCQLIEITERITEIAKFSTRDYIKLQIAICATEVRRSLQLIACQFPNIGNKLSLMEARALRDV